MARYGMVIDTRKCIGCHTCAVACRTAKNLPKEMWYIKVNTEGGEAMDTSAGQFPNVTLSYRPVSCMQCSNPACVAACPTGASHIREDGIIAIDTDVCIGCQSCIAACPYPGVRQYNGEEPEFDVDFALGAADAPKHVYNTVEKCNFCFERLERGEVPYCMEACPMRCRIIGDLDDPESEVSRLLAEREYFRLNEEAGTEPNVYYLK